MRKLFILLFVISHVATADELEGIIGANYTNYQESEETKAGIGAKLKYNWYEAGSTGYFAQGLFRGESILNVDAIIGFGYKSLGSSFFEVGAGLALNPNFGYGLGTLAGVGTELGEGWYVNMLLVYFGGGLNHATITPMIGFRI